ncbi:MAG: major facilitator superfamily domain-containing protein 6 [Rhodocyclaceae bacterium]
MRPYWRLSAYYFFYFAFVGAFAPYFSLYLASLAFSAWQIGVLMSLMQAMRVIAPNLWGWLADRIGRRTLIVRVSAAASVLGFAGLCFTRSFSGVFLALAVMALFWGAALPLVEAITLGHLGSRIERYGAIRLWGSIGFIAAASALGFVLDRSAIGALLPVAMGILAGILACAMFLPEAAEGPRESAPGGLAGILRRREVLALLAACFAMSAAHGALYVFYSIHLVGNGYSKSAVGWLWTLGVLAEIVVFLRMPRLAGRHSLRAILAFSFGCAVLRFLLIGWGVRQPALVVVAQLLHGATFGAYHAAAVAAVNRWFPHPYQARGQALYSSVSFGAGGMLGGVLSGATWEALGAGPTYTVSALFAAAGLAFVLGGWREKSSAEAAAR